MNDVKITEAEFWHVQLVSGEVRYWSLEELDEAFQRDEVDAKTYVLKEGETSWQRLGELLGLDEVQAAPVAVSAPTPMATALSSHPSSPPASIRESELPSALSIRPVVSDLADLDDDDLVAALKPQRKNLAAIGGGAALALVLLIVGVTRASSSADDKAVAAGASLAAASVSAPVTAATPEPVAAQPTLSEETKRTLLEADKARAAKAAAKAAENAKYHSTYVGGSRAPKTGPVFHKGGNQYDPLSSGQ
jgi:hypothetical protein